MFKYLISFILFFNVVISQDYTIYWESLNYLGKDKREVINNMSDEYYKGYIYKDSVIYYNIDDLVYVVFKFNKNNTCKFYSISYTTLKKIEDYMGILNLFNSSGYFIKEKETKDFSNLSVYYSLVNSNIKVGIFHNIKGITFIFYY